MSIRTPKPEPASQKLHNPLIEKTMCVGDILTILPDAGPLIAQYGLHCFQCSANTVETLEEGCRSHGFMDEEIDDLVTDLNELLTSRPTRPQTLTLTEPAAHALQDLLTAEGKATWGLLVGLDEGGGFCMEFLEAPLREHTVFSNATVPTVRLFATTLTLAGIGGATIDFREGRFKLDLPEDTMKKGCACESGGGCGCGEN